MHDCLRPIKIASHVPNNSYIYKPQTNIWRGLCTHKTGLKPQINCYYPFRGDASVVVYSNCHCSCILIVIVRPLSVFFDFSFVLFRKAWWSCAKKKLSSWLSACTILLYAVLCSFPFGVWSRMCNSIYQFLSISFFIFYFAIIYFYLYSCIFLSADWSIDLIHVSTKLSPGNAFGKWLVSRALQTL